MTTEFITKPAASLMTRVTSNRHTSIAAGIWLASSVMEQLGPIWFPAHAEQFKQTANAIEKIAVGYGLLMAGDSKPTPPENPPTGS